LNILSSLAAQAVDQPGLLALMLAAVVAPVE
jgi:hypothetical protein